MLNFLKTLNINENEIKINKLNEKLIINDQLTKPDIYFLKNMSNLVDSHCHLYYEPYINDIQGTIDICKNNNINKLLSIGVDLTTSKKILSLFKNIMKYIAQ